MAMPYRTLGKMSDGRRKEIRQDATRFLDGLSDKPDHQGRQAVTPK